MPRSFRESRFFAVAVGLILMALGPARAPAAWLGFKNDTGTQVVVQLAIPHNGKLLYGKARTLNPGEVVWDNIPPGARQVCIFDPKQPQVPVLSQLSVIGTQDVYLSIRLEPARPPIQPRTIVRLVPVKPPILPGQMPAPTTAKPVGPKGPTAPPPTQSIPPNAAPPKSMHGGLTPTAQ